MTVSSTTNKSGPYLGNGSTVDFDYEFRILDPSHVTVIMTQGGVDTTVSPSDYTVSGVGAAPGGTLTFLVAPTTGQSITIIRNAPFTQQTDLENQGAYYAETVEASLDLAVMRDQQLAEGLSRAVQIPIGADPSALTGLIEDVIRLADSADEIDIVAGIAADVTTVAGISAHVATVAGIAADVTTVAGIADEVNAVAAIAADVTVAADNIAAIVAAPGHAAAAIAAEVGAEAAQAAAEAAAASIDYLAVADRTILKAVDTSNHTAALLKEAGRDGIFIWRAGDYSAQIAADPLEGIFVKANAVAAASGAWVRQAGYNITGIDIRWFGAVPQGNPSDTTTAIQRAMNLAAVIGAGKVKIPRSEWRLGKTTTETWQTTAMPVGMQDQYALLVPSGVTLEGDGFLSHLKRHVAASLIVVLLAETTGTKVTNLRIDGDATNFPIAGATYGSGAGVIVESLSGTEDKTNILDTIWIRDTPGYGIGAGWGHRRGLTMRNIFIDGTGSDGIDLKRANAGAFDAFGVVIDNVLVENFGRTATDGAQAGVDIRGYVTASNIHVRKFGAAARAGIRLRGGIAGDNVIGGHRSTLSNYRVVRISGGEATTYGLEVNADGVSTTNGSVEGCTINVGHMIVGVTTGMIDVVHTGVHSFSAGTYGFRTTAEARGVRFIGCSDYLSPTGFRIEGDEGKLIAPMLTGSGGVGIDIAATADKTSIIQPAFTSTFSAPIQNAGTNTNLWQDGVFYSGVTRSFSYGGTGDSSPSALATNGAAVILAESSNADADISLNTKGLGYHALGGAKTQTTVGAAGGATALPATPTGYLQIKIAGTIRKIPFYAN